MNETDESQRDDVKVGDVFDVDGLEWKVHRVAHYRVAACNRVDEHGLRHYRTFALAKLRAAPRVEPAKIP